MRSFLPWATMATLVVLSVTAAGVERAQAMPPFKKVFDAKYVKPDSADANQQAFAAAVKKANCNVCHVGKKKKERNLYGQALDKLIEKKEKDAVKIEAALDEVARQKSNPDDPNSPTFGELIEQGKLPAG